MNKKILSLSVLILLGVLAISIVSAGWFTGKVTSDSQRIYSSRNYFNIKVGDNTYQAKIDKSSTSSNIILEIKKDGISESFKMKNGESKKLSKFQIEVKASGFYTSRTTRYVYLALSDVTCASGESWSEGKCVSSSSESAVTYQGVLEMLGKCSFKSTADNTKNCASVCNEINKFCLFGQAILFGEMKENVNTALAITLACGDPAQEVSDEFPGTVDVDTDCLCCSP